MRPVKVRMACSRTNSNAILQPEIQLQPKLLLQPKRQFAAERQFAAQTIICSQNANLQPNRQFATDCQFAAQTPIFILKCIFAALTHFSCQNACIPEELPRKNCRACCRGSKQCAAPKSPKGQFAGQKWDCSHANSPGSVVRKAYDGKSKWPVLEQIRTQFCSQNSNCSPNANLQPKSQFATERQVVAHTPICILNVFSQPKRISAAQTHVYQRYCSAKTAGPAASEACDERP